VQIYYNSSSITGFDSISGETVDPSANTQINQGMTIPQDINNQREEMIKITLLKAHKKDIVNLYMKKDIDNKTGKSV
jgi:hypothetical protein